MCQSQESKWSESKVMSSGNFSYQSIRQPRKSQATKGEGDIKNDCGYRETNLIARERSKRNRDKKEVHDFL